MADAPSHTFGPALYSQLPRLSRSEQISQWQLALKTEPHTHTLTPPLPPNPLFPNPLPPNPLFPNPHRP